MPSAEQGKSVSARILANQANLRKARTLRVYQITLQPVVLLVYLNIRQTFDLLF